MLSKFTLKKIKTSEVTINFRIAGNGPPVLFLHGYPQTHVMWHKIAPSISKDFTVILSDLRGYGDSSKPRSDNEHITYSKKKMALDQIELMQKIGFKNFSIVGHDRGARVAHRMMRDYPKLITKAILMDIVPTLEMYEKTDKNFATAYYHWFLLIQPYDFPEKLIGNDPKYFLKNKLRAWGRKKNFITRNAFNEYLRCFSNPKTIHASCEDYRASASIDLYHDKFNAAEKILTPLLVLWGKDSFVGSNYNVINSWNQVAKNVQGQGVEGGHYIPEETPQEAINIIMNFLK